MLNDAAGFKRIFIAAGYTDLRRGIDGLAGIVQYQFELDPHNKDTIFLFWLHGFTEKNRGTCSTSLNLIHTTKIQSFYSAKER